MYKIDLKATSGKGHSFELATVLNGVVKMQNIKLESNCLRKKN